LEKPVSLEFTDQPLEECIQFLRAQTDANIITDTKAFAGGGADAKTPITLRLSNTKLGLALRWILRMAKLDYALKDGAIFISTPNNLQGELVQKMYDVRDLTFQIQPFPGPTLGLSGGGGGAGGGAGGGGGGGGGAMVQPAQPVQIIPPNTLKDMIQKVIRPNSWVGGNVSISENNGKLMVVHQPEVHAQISQLLEDFRKTQTIQVHVEARYVDVSQGFLEEIGVDWGGNPAVDWTMIPSASTGSSTMFDGNHPSIDTSRVENTYAGAWDSSFGRPDGNPGRITQRYQAWNTGRNPGSALGSDYFANGGPGEGLSLLFTYLGNWQAQMLVRAIKKEARGTVLFAPRLTMFNNQRAHVFVGRQTSYISGWSSSGDVFTPDVSSAILDGVALDVRPIVSHDRRYITLELRPTLVRPVRNRSFTTTSSTSGTSGLDTDDDADGILNTAETSVANAQGADTGNTDIDGDGLLNTVDPDIDGDGLLNGTGGGGTSNLSFSLPELEVRTIRTVVTVPDGGTVLLSGLMTETQSDQHQGIPFLMNLPVIGRLFGNNYKDIERRNLLILVTSRLILFAEEEQKL
jgi:type II secretory pathway component GspD/PulD (secretin)